jgi:hypothetical protein
MSILEPFRHGPMQGKDDDTKETARLPPHSSSGRDYHARWVACRNGTRYLEWRPTHPRHIIDRWREILKRLLARGNH